MDNGQWIVGDGICCALFSRLDDNRSICVPQKIVQSSTAHFLWKGFCFGGLR